ncbi:MAG: cellulose biosynthesis protein BcsS [Gammaproteobacteria bacterium]|nr:MAG: cellulose biosynthesis protein BcsS [Gammaproteobacteria bacterium]
MSAMRCLLLCIGLLASGLAGAQQRLLLGGLEIADEAFYGYTGVVIPPAARGRQRGLVQRYWLDHLGYAYDGGPGRVEARAWGAEAALGYTGATASGWGTVSLGLRLTDTTLAPDDPGAGARGSQFAGHLQLEGEREWVPGWRLGAIASVTTRRDEYWLRLRSMHRTGSAWSPGVEFVAGGNSETRSRAIGLVLAFRPAGRSWSVVLKGGARRQDGDAAPYAGIELAR